MSSDAKRAANARYLGKMATVTVRMSPEARDDLQAYTASRGESVNGYILRLIRQDMGKDNPQNPN